MARLHPSSLLAVVAAALMLAALTAPLSLAVGGREPVNHGGPVAHGAIIGGTPAEDGAYPSAAYILDFLGKGFEQCTGTVVAPSLVLTAGHCAENMLTGTTQSAAGYRVLTGQVDWATGQRQVSEVLGVIPYPGFSRRVDAGDAALLVLSTPVSAPPMLLAASSQANLFSAGTAATLAGWGKTSSADRTLTERLQFASTVVQPTSWCKRNAKPFFPRWELCTISPSAFATGACEGDSGGPLLVPGKGAGEALEVGITVHVYGGCSPRRPTVYTRVDALSGWLRSWIAAYSTTERTPLAPTPPG